MNAGSGGAACALLLAWWLATLATPAQSAQEAPTPPSASDARPNILFVLTDDQRWQSLGFTGRSPVATPELDRLAREGVRFREALAVMPLCCPSRATFLTGQPPHRTGVYSNEVSKDVLRDQPTFPKLLHEAGYATAMIGKWHLPRSTRGGEAQGFDHWVSFPRQGHYFDQPMDVNGEVVPTEGHITDVLMEQALQWLRAPREQPFLLYLSLRNCHAPPEPPERYRGRLDGTPFPDPSLIEGREADEVARIEEHWRRYHELVLQVDECIGRLREFLEEREDARSTLLLFTSDHGFLFGEHGTVGKSGVSDTALRIPLIAWQPGVLPPGLEVTQPVLNLDVAPTLLDLAGIEIPSILQGRSLRPLWESSTPEWRTATLHYGPIPAGSVKKGNTVPALLAVRTAEWKLVLHRPGDGEPNELYDLTLDPEELANQYTQQPRRVRRMQQVLAELMRSSDFPASAYSTFGLPMRGRAIPR